MFAVLPHCTLSRYQLRPYMEWTFASPAHQPPVHCAAKSPFNEICLKTHAAMFDLVFAPEIALPYHTRRSCCAFSPSSSSSSSSFPELRENYFLWLLALSLFGAIAIKYRSKPWCLRLFAFSQASFSPLKNRFLCLSPSSSRASRKTKSLRLRATSLFISRFAKTFHLSASRQRDYEDFFWLSGRVRERERARVLGRSGSEAAD